MAREPGKSRWEITDEKVVDTHVGLFRNTGMACMPFQKFELAREGMTLSASNGSLCEAYFEGHVSSFVVKADDLKYGYAPPEHATLVPTGHDYYAFHELAERVHRDQLSYEPAGVIVQCDVESCEEFLTKSFTGVDRPAPEERAKYDYDDSTIADWIQPMVNDILRSRKERPFSGFRLLDEPGNRWYSIFLPSEFKDRNDGIQLSYNNWGVTESGWEVMFFVWPQRWDVPNQLTRAIYGYFSEETLKSAEPYELEQRSGGLARWLEVETIKGRVDLATIDAEKVQGDVEFGLVLRQDTDKLPFGIISNRRGGGSRPKPITVNSIRVEGDEVTWIKTGPTGGIVPRSCRPGRSSRCVCTGRATRSSSSPRPTRTCRGRAGCRSCASATSSTSSS